MNCNELSRIVTNYHELSRFATNCHEFSRIVAGYLDIVDGVFKGFTKFKNRLNPILLVELTQTCSRFDIVSEHLTGGGHFTKTYFSILAISHFFKFTLLRSLEGICDPHCLSIIPH